jgi:hypothetical protein
MEENPYEAPKTQHAVDQPRWSVRRVTILVLGCLFLIPLSAWCGAAVGVLIAIATVPPEQGLQDDTPLSILRACGASIGALVGVVFTLYLSRRFAHPSRQK